VYQVVEKKRGERRACKIVDKEQFVEYYGEDRLERARESYKFMNYISKTVTNISNYNLFNI